MVFITINLIKHLFVVIKQFLRHGFVIHLLNIHFSFIFLQDQLKIVFLQLVQVLCKMPHSRQIFQTESSLRWNSFKWTFRIFLFFFFIMIVIIALSVFNSYSPVLPKLKNEDFNFTKLDNPLDVKELTPKEKKIYKGFELYLAERKKNEEIRKSENKSTLNLPRIRAGFYVAWDPQSFYSLQKHIDKLNMIFPEWFFIDPKTDTLVVQVDSAALALMRNYPVKIVPILSNVDYTTKKGGFSGEGLHRIFHDEAKRTKLIESIISKLKEYRFHGVNIDFEELKEDGDEPLIEFSKQLHNKLAEKNLLMTTDIMPSNEDFNIPKLAELNDYLILMAYDEHYTVSDPGPVSEQRWIEKTLDEAAKEIPSKKIILGMAAYGYDWPAGNEAITVTYQKALADAKIYKQKIIFDNDTYNNYYNYSDDDGLKHEVYFTDAATNFNIMRFADEYGTAGTVIWRLGSEDERLWTFYNRDLSDLSLAQTPYDFEQLKLIELSTDKPDYDGDGEIMDVIARPQKGIIDLEIDSNETLISEQQYRQLPTRYVIKKYGKVNKQVVLTFDDGPDPVYTTQILDILKRENIKASFFIIGINGEANLPLLKRIVREGHEIGNHTFTHPNMATVGTSRAKSELSATRLLIEAATGRSTVLYRIPFNADSEPTNAEELKPVALGTEYSYYTIGESIDPLDWKSHPSADTIVQRVIKRYEENPDKGIILLHDGGGDREETVKALPGIINYFNQKGVQFISLGQLLNKSSEELMPVVNSDVLKINSGFVTFFYWLGRFMLSAFWVAIFLFLAKTILLGIMATIQFNKTKKDKLIPVAGISNEEVSVIIPAYNEEVNAVKTISSLLQQTYPALKIIFVDDGSTDKTIERVKEAFGNNLHVKIISKPNGGKASALNEGIRHAETPYIVCIDGDTQLKPDAVEKLMACFLSAENDQKEVGAVAGNVKVGNRKNMLTHWQHIEYVTAQNFDRRAFDLINGITVVPGAIGAFKKEAVIEAGGFTSDTLAEDCDLTIRLLRGGYVVRNCVDAIAITEAPETLSQFMKQRFRWNYGVMQSFWKNRDACFNSKFKALGLISLPNILIYQIILPFLAPLADLMLVVSLIWSWNNTLGMEKILFYYIIFLLVDVFISLIAFVFEKEKIKELLWLIPQRFIYRQLMYIVLFRSVRMAIKGELQGWGVLKRTGNVRPSFK